MEDPRAKFRQGTMTVANKILAALARYNVVLSQNGAALSIAIEDSKEYLKASETDGRHQLVMAQSRTSHRNV